MLERSFNELIQDDGGYGDVLCRFYKRRRSRIRGRPFECIASGNLRFGRDHETET